MFVSNGIAVFQFRFILQTDKANKKIAGSLVVFLDAVISLRAALAWTHASIFGLFLSSCRFLMTVCTVKQAHAARLADGTVEESLSETVRAFFVGEACRDLLWAVLCFA